MFAKIFGYALIVTGVISFAKPALLQGWLLRKTRWKFFWIYWLTVFSLGFHFVHYLRNDIRITKSFADGRVLAAAMVLCVIIYLKFLSWLTKNFNRVPIYIFSGVGVGTMVVGIWTLWAAGYR